MRSGLLGFAVGILFASACWNCAFWWWYMRDETMPGAGLEKLREWFRQTVPAVCICESFSKIPGNPEFADVAWCGFHSILIANKNGVISESEDGIAWTSRGGSPSTRSSEMKGK